MTRSTKLLLVVLAVAIFWPPFFTYFFADRLRPKPQGLGGMRDFELQLLMNANRWEVDIPADKTGWYLGFVCKEGEKISRTGGSTVIGNSKVVILARRNTHENLIEYAWYSPATVKTTHNVGPLALTLKTSSHGAGNFADPLAHASVTTELPEGKVRIGDAIYRGGTKAVHLGPADAPSEYEVRLELSPPHGSEQD